MNKLYILIFLLFISINLNGQLKKVTFGDKQPEATTIIEVPSFKKTNSKANLSTKQFSPQKMTFQLSEKNGLNVQMRGANNLPIFIQGKPTQTLRFGNSPEDIGYNFLENAKELMNIENPSSEFEPILTQTDELGMTHVKYQQIHKGIPVYGAEVIVHFDHKNQILNGRYLSTPTVDDVTPQLDNNQVESLVIAEVGGIVNLEEDKFNLFDFEKITSDLVIYEDRLCYELTVYKNIVDRWEYIVDAKSGEVIRAHQNICKFHNHVNHGECSHNHTIANDNNEAITNMPPPDGPSVSNAQDLFGTNRQINTYESGGSFYLIDAARTMYDNANSNIPNDPVGTVWTIDAFNTSPQNSNFEYDHVISNTSSFSGKQTGVSAQYNGGEAYEYFKNVHSRESINGSGGNVIGLINIADEDGSTLGNAFWNGVAMFYGNGDSSFQPLARGLDVAGHEMSHGVVQSTANLEYQGESGALNESFADIFGAMIDRDDWLVGEDVVKTSAFPSGALRSLQDPHNGASTGNFNAGWQPRIYSERFTGSQDNGGVHINSGIPNYAFFLFATSNGVGKDKAEQVYYRALDKYLTKSSQFIDARLAVVQAATDLYGTGVANSAKAAFDQVEIFNGNGTTTQTDVDVNPGADLILFTTEDQNNLYIADADGNLIFNPLTEQDPLSVPSITDDGSEIIFINQDKELYYIQLDWSNNTIIEEGIITSNESWRNAVFSKDGLRMAALRDAEENKVFVYDFEQGSGIDYELYNPTFTEGVNTGDVLYADALEFDFSGEYLMYDAFNRIQSATGSAIDYWDIAFIKVFNKDSGTFTLGNDLNKLFSQLPDDVSIGNPTFSKNSDYIIAFDYLEGNEFTILGSNIETGETKSIFEDNDRPGYPDYSKNDDKVIFDAANSANLGVIGGAVLQSNKIESNSANIQLAFEETGVRWGVWFGNGDRALANEEVDLPSGLISLFPNPAGATVTLNSNIEDAGKTTLTVVDIMGRTVIQNEVDQLSSDVNIDVSKLISGQYILNVKTEKGTTSQMFVKQ